MVRFAELVASDMDQQIDFHDGETFDDWAFENLKLVWWVTYRIARATNGMMGRKAGSLDELYGLVLEGMWLAWPKYNGTTKLSNWLVFCGKRYAIWKLNKVLRADASQPKQLSWVKQCAQERIDQKSNSASSWRYEAFYDRAAESRGPLDDAIKAEDAQERTIALYAALTSLRQRHQAAVLRRSNGETLRAIGASLGISKERARQLAMVGMTELRERFFGFLEGTWPKQKIEREPKQKQYASDAARYNAVRKRIGGKKPEGITKLQKERRKKRKPRLCSADAAWLGVVA